MRGIPFKNWEIQAHNEGRKSSFVRVVKGLPEDAEFGGVLLDSTSQEDTKDIGKCIFKTSEPTKKMGCVFVKPPYQVGDILYIKETWHYNPLHEYGTEPEKYVYKSIYDGHAGEFGWKSPIHMPEEAARSFIRITGVKVMRVQDITREDAINVGLTKLFDYLSKEEYEDWAKRTGETRTQEECGYTNYLWHGHFGDYGTGNKMSDTWKLQTSAFDSPEVSFASLWERDNFKQRDKMGWDANLWVWVYEYEVINKENING